MSKFSNGVRALKSKSIHTVTGRTSFAISDITEGDLTVVPDATGIPRPISREKFEDAFKKASGSPIRPKDVREWGYSLVHTSYVAAIVNEILKEDRKRRPV